MSEDFPFYDRDVDEAAERAYRASQKLPPASSTTGRVPLERARTIAGNLLEVLAPACERIEIAGSIRRQKPDVKDIELVAIPKGVSLDLFGEPVVEDRTELDVVISGLLEDGLLEAREPRRMGRRYQALRAIRTGLAIDLFLVLPPAQWGAIFAIRTGSADFSKFLVTEATKHGRRVRKGRLIDLADVSIDTPEERDFFRECRVQWIPPEARS